MKFPPKLFLRLKLIVLLCLLKQRYYDIAGVKMSKRGLSFDQTNSGDEQPMRSPAEGGEVELDDEGPPSTPPSPQNVTGLPAETRGASGLGVDFHSSFVSFLKND